MRRPAGWVLWLLALAGAACLDVDSDPCADLECGEGEVCVALSRGPICVCDTEHEPDGVACAPLGEGEGEGEGEEG